MDPNPAPLIAANDAGYDTEVLCAGWNPLAGAAPLADGTPPPEASAGRADADSFLTRYYCFQQT